MNVVRYYLALCILMNHYNILTGFNLPTLPRIFGGVGSFFALSGFLMFYSYERHADLKGYVARRLKRILPPYVFIVLLASFSLVAVSTLSWQEYFSNPQFYKYLLYNLLFLNFLQPSLPGVFDNGIMLDTAVNGALWTMKGEVICYLMVPLVYKLISRRPKKASWMLAILMLACFIAYITFELLQGYLNRDFNVISRQFRVFTFFYAGALINVNFEKIRKYKWQTLAIVVVLIALASLKGYYYEIVIRPFSDSMLVIWCSMIGAWGAFLSKYNSISYQVYLFHWPIIQVLLSCGIISSVGAVAGLFLAITLTFVLAAFSWFCIDKPILNSNGIRFPHRKVRG